MKQKASTDIEMENELAGVLVSVGEENSVFTNLSTSLAEIHKLKGVIGYILRSNTSAIVDLNDSEKIIDYAALSSELNESCPQMSKEFNLGPCESILVEGESVKVLCMNIGENKISIFLEKTINPDWIIKRILL